MADSERVDIAAIMRDGTAVNRAVARARLEMIERHRMLGIPIVIWRDGKVVSISPDEALRMAGPMPDERP